MMSIALVAPARDTSRFLPNAGSPWPACVGHYIEAESTLDGFDVPYRAIRLDGQDLRRVDTVVDTPSNTYKSYAWEISSIEWPYFSAD